MILGHFLNWIELKQVSAKTWIETGGHELKQVSLSWNWWAWIETGGLGLKLVGFKAWIKTGGHELKLVDLDKTGGLKLKLVGLNLNW